ncbi:hypothetical protein [Corynebacterium tapiri]|uniref:Uncharacterized protein n=1 Tax=Corynebacterium tapiri TaxID=1448266 RepID=A0A5C4U6M3_9CORY|nr:hypothetical protein [Corynebacterium tapiri]TNL98730.1 hypothetical protein FHE74_03660 [Corynebacterium tapiri]
MPVKFSIGLNDATFSDLITLVDAARNAQVDPATEVVIEGDELAVVTEDTTQTADVREPRHASAESPLPPRPAPGAGAETALKFIAELLNSDQRHSR